MLALLLDRLGAGRVEVATDGVAAVSKARELLPDVVLLDIGLPGKDGYQVARELRGHRELDGVVLVALTGYGQEQDRLRSREAGFDEHLVKPASIDDLQRVLAMTRPIRDWIGRSATPLRRRRSGRERRANALRPQRQVAQPRSGRGEDGVGDRRRGRALRRLAGAHRRIVGTLDRPPR